MRKCHHIESMQLVLGAWRMLVASIIGVRDGGGWPFFLSLFWCWYNLYVILLLGL